MANYNTFAVVDSKQGEILLITSSARKASEMLCEEKHIEVWNNNEKFITITHENKDRMRAFVRIEKDFIRRKQEKATKKNKYKRSKKNGHHENG